MRTLLYPFAPWILAILGGCSLQPFGPHVKMTIVVDPARAEKALDLSDSLFRAPGALSAPANSSLFDCLAVNVMGPGIANSDPQGTGAGGTYNPPSSYCSYAGVTSPPLTNSDTAHEVNLSVPTGTGRIFQLVGILQGNTSVCSFGGPVGGYTSSGFSTDEYYEMGSARLDLFSATTVTIANSYVQSDTRRLDCGGRVLSITRGADGGAGCSTALPIAGFPHGTGFGVTEYATSDSTYNVGGCVSGSVTNPGSGFHEFEFDVSGISGAELATYTRISVRWQGKGGAKSNPCAASDAPTSGGAQLFLFKNSIPGWQSISGATATANAETLDGSVSGISVSDFVTGGKIYLAAMGPNAGIGMNCSLVYTDFVAMRLEK